MNITESDNVHHIEQDFYMSKIEQIPSTAEFRKLSVYENETRMASKY